ncbi:DUF5345 family protein [Paenibacillus harenae]|uniref:DUF5345 family protein n=1 Tax=Paenibacillus harenae TaxID=306543 RepID=UPI000420CAB3|nr:DUF5345 family protein [Paenibacillus harenae]
MKKKPSNSPDDQQWFDERLGDAIRRFDENHLPETAELQAFEQLVLAHKQGLKKKLWKELLLFWLTSCFIFGSMMWVLEQNWVGFPVMQAVIAAGGIIIALMKFGNRTGIKWKS